MTPEQMKALQQKTREIRNDDLLKIIRQMKAKAPEPPTPEEHVEYVEQLLKARLIVPVSFGEEDKEHPNRLQVQFSHLTNNKKERYFMAFTDMETLLKNAKDDEKLNVLGITYEDFVRMLSEPKSKMTGFAINPFTENIICGPEQGRAIGRYIAQKKVESGELTMINELSEIPDDVLRTLEKGLDRFGNVKKAYLMAMRKGDQRSRLLILDADETVTDFGELAKQFAAEVLKPINDPKCPYLIMSYAEKAATQATKEKVPFYVKV